MSLQLGTYAFWFFTAMVFLLLTGILLKTKWWQTRVGRNQALLAAAFFMVTVIIVAVQIQLFQPFIREWGRFIIYGSMGIVLAQRVYILYKYNWNFWAWSKEDKDDR